MIDAIAHKPDDVILPKEITAGDMLIQAIKDTTNRSVAGLVFEAEKDENLTVRVMLTFTISLDSKAAADFLRAKGYDMKFPKEQP